MKSKNLRLLAAATLLLFSKNLTASPASFLVNSLPRITCKDLPAISIMPTGMRTVWVQDFIESLEDDLFFPAELEVSMRKKCVGQGFPTDANGNPIPGATFTCNELGDQVVEIWVRNPDGKTDSCDANFWLIDQFDNCSNSLGGGISVCLETPTGQPIRNASLQFKKTSFPTSTSVFAVDSTGCRRHQQVIAQFNINITPIKDDNPLNGVTTFDLLTMSRHILGTKPFDTPWQLIAADINRSGSVTTNDIVELRKLILGIYTDLPQNDSWRFVWRGHQFPNSADPFSTALPEEVSVFQLQQSNCAGGFVGVKIGDPSVNATPAFAPDSEADDRREPLNFFIENQKLTLDEPVLLPVFLKEKTALAGFQFELENFEAGQILGLVAGQVSISEEHFFVASDGSRCSVSWIAGDAAGQVLLPDLPLFYLKIGGVAAAVFSEKLVLKNSRLRPEAYYGGATRPLVFQFSEKKSSSGGAAADPVFYPNPTGGRQAWLFFENKNESDLPLNWEVFDLAGRSILRGSEVLPSGVRRVLLPLDFLPAGEVFYLKILVGSRVFGQVFRV